MEYWTKHPLYTPLIYSPFHRSQTDVCIYHEEYFKKGAVTSVTFFMRIEEVDVDEDDNEDKSKEVTRQTCSCVWEMKSDGKALK